MEVDDKFVRDIFLERLPTDVQTILASASEDLTVSQLAEMAHRIIEVQRFQPPSVAKISSSSSPWASPLHVVPKATSGDWRSSCDYRALNSATIPDRYPVHHLQNFDGALFGKAVFSKIDLVRAFHQSPVAPADISETAVTTPFGLFEFIRMPFGLGNAALTFQRFIGHVLRGLPFVYAYIDDLLMASRNEEEHKEHLSLVFDHLDKFGVVINPYMCVLGVPSLEFLGDKVESKGPLELTGEALTAFERIKNSLADATLLTHPAPEAQLSLMVDASTVAVGAVLQQRIAGSTQPLAFFSKKLLPAETRYSTFGSEIPGVESHFTLYHSGPRDSSGRHGVAIALSQQAELALLAWEPVNDRMAYVQLKGHFTNISIVAVYAPTSAAEQAFYSQLQALVERLPRRDLLIVAGDWNGRTGPGDPTTSHLLGRFGLGSRCENGERLLNFADRNRLLVTNTCS
nr:unnamed protein product [Spirometra erinaceieuropaei]